MNGVFSLKPGDKHRPSHMLQEVMTLVLIQTSTDLEDLGYTRRRKNIIRQSIMLDNWGKELATITHMLERIVLLVLLRDRTGGIKGKNF